MEIVVNKLDGCKRELEITVPSEKPDEEYRKLLNKFKGNLQMPGFRRGKVPGAVIEKRFGKELIQEVIEELVPKVLQEAIEKENLRPVEQPARDDVIYKLGGPMTIKASFEIIPDIKLKKYSGLSVSIKGSEYKVKKKDIDAQIEMLRDRSATFEPMLEDRATKAGDFAVINVRGESDAENAIPFNRDEVMVDIKDSDEDGGFSKNLIGMKNGGKGEFSVAYPEDFSDPSLAGNTYKYEVELKEVRKQILPELDDEFAKDLGQFESLDALKGEIKRQLTEEKDRAKRSDTESKLAEKLVKENDDFDLPQVMIHRQQASNEYDLRRDMQNRGMNPDHVGFDWVAFAKEQLPASEMSVRRIILVDAVAEKEEIKVTTKDIKAEIDNIALSMGTDARKLRQEMLQDGRYESVADHLQQAKVFDWLIDNNEVKEGK